MGLLTRQRSEEVPNVQTPQPRKLQRMCSGPEDDVSVATPERPERARLLAAAAEEEEEVAPASRFNEPVIPERKAFRKPPRKLGRNIAVLEAPRDAAGDTGAADASNERSGPARGQDGGRRGYKRLERATKEDADKDADVDALLDRLAEGFAEDYWQSPTCARPPPASVLAQLMSAGGKALEEGTSRPSRSVRSVAHILAERQDGWFRRLKLGFSLLFEGVGSKRLLLETFADQVLLPWGADVARFDAFDARASLPGFLRELLAQVNPGFQGKGGVSAEALAAAVRAARLALPAPVRPLVLVVHNLEALPLQHQTALAALVAAPGVLLAASVDHVMAPLLWSLDVLKDYNFCREVVHTMQGYEVELKGKYPDLPPAWCDPSADRQNETKVSMGLVLRSLTNNHRELVEAMAKNQLSEGGREGISMGDLLAIAEDRMIASSVTKLRSLLNELTDHDVVTTRASSGGGTLYFIPSKDNVLRKLASGEAPDVSDGEAGQDGEEDEDDEEDDDDGGESGGEEDPALAG